MSRINVDIMVTKQWLKKHVLFYHRGSKIYFLCNEVTNTGSKNRKKKHFRHNFPRESCPPA